MSDTTWLRVVLGPGCWATVLVSREPTRAEVEMLVRYLCVVIDAPVWPPPPPAPPAVEPTPEEPTP